MAGTGSARFEWRPRGPHALTLLSKRARTTNLNPDYTHCGRAAGATGRVRLSVEPLPHPRGLLSPASYKVPACRTRGKKGCPNGPENGSSPPTWTPAPLAPAAPPSKGRTPARRKKMALGASSRSSVSTPVRAGADKWTANLYGSCCQDGAVLEWRWGIRLAQKRASLATRPSVSKQPGPP